MLYAYTNNQNANGWVSQMLGFKFYVWAMTRFKAV